MTNIVSFSGGKDSTAMLHLLLDEGIKVDRLLYFETEWDFPQMAAHLSLVEKNTGLKVTKIRNYRYFSELLALWGWPKSSGGWCTACKRDNCVKYVRGIKGEKTEFIGFSADEVKRTQTGQMLKRKWPVRFPLIEAGMGEADSLRLCKSLGYHWDGLYDVMDRVSCFCCPKGGKSKRKTIRENFPALWSKWLALDAVADNANQGRVSV